MIFEERRRLIVDFDSTLVNSIKAFCHVYNTIYIPKGYPYANWRNVQKWNFVDECVAFLDIAKEEGEHRVTEIVNEIFSSDDFFNALEFYPNAKETMQFLHENDIDNTICTFGTAENVAKKVIFIKKHLPFANIIPIVQISNIFKSLNKSIVNMENCVFIDDRADNVITSNADISICYIHEGRTYPWNEGFKGLTATEWTEPFKERLLYLLDPLNPKGKPFIHSGIDLKELKQLN